MVGKIITLLNLDSDSDDEYDMTAEEEKVYSRQVEESEGFDVDEVPGTLMFHQIRPIYLFEGDESTDIAVSLTKAAIHEYNNTEFKKTEGELEYHELLIATQQLLCGFMFRLTFNAKNFAKKGELHTYQAVVLMGLKEKPEVLSFRPKPSGSEKIWYWEGHRCGKYIFSTKPIYCSLPRISFFVTRDVTDCVNALYQCFTILVTFL